MRSIVNSERQRVTELEQLTEAARTQTAHIEATNKASSDTPLESQLGL